MNTSSDTHPVNPTDRLLSEFFQAEMPAPWPAWKLPHPAEPRRDMFAAIHPNAAVRVPPTAGRWTLVVSAAVLFGFGLLLTREAPSGYAERSALHPDTGHTLFHQATADGSKLQPPVDKTLKKMP
ncbi:MAG: hypothetical protein LC104_15300 [Bacteroidales bacterium]|nr:hypothetical protein [Bacteroidales bacterium]